MTTTAEPAASPGTTGSLEKGRASYDISHRWVSTITYELPIGKGKKYMSYRQSQERRLRGMGTHVRPDVSDRTSVYCRLRRQSQPVPAGLQPPHADRAQRSGQTGACRYRAKPLPLLREKRYLDINGFRYPDSFTVGTLGRNTLEAPGIVWGQASLAKEWPVHERLKFSLRFDANNFYKYHSFNPPNSTYNATDPSNFGTFNGTRGSFSDIGTGRWHGIMVFRVMW